MSLPVTSKTSPVAAVAPTDGQAPSFCFPRDGRAPAPLPDMEGKRVTP